MGFLNSNTQVVDAILTRYGRDKLAHGGQLGIARFALSDDGVDYDLWNANHPSGSTSFGEAIENMPVLEAFPDEDALLTYKLEHGNRTRSRSQVIYFDATEKIIMPGTPSLIEPKSTNGGGKYIFKIQDAAYATFIKTPSNVKKLSRRLYPSNKIEFIAAGVPNGLSSVNVKGIHKQDTRTVKLTAFSLDRQQFATIKLVIVGTEDPKYNTQFSVGER